MINAAIDLFYRFFHFFVRIVYWGFGPFLYFIILHKGGVLTYMVATFYLNVPQLAVLIIIYIFVVMPWIRAHFMDD